jgi:hypothetical protein
MKVVVTLTAGLLVGACVSLPVQAHAQVSSTSSATLTTAPATGSTVTGPSILKIPLASSHSFEITGGVAGGTLYVQ